MADTLAPALFLRRPRHGASDVRLSANIVLEVWDTDTGVNAASVVIKVDGVVAWTGDAQQSGFVVTKRVLVGGGIQYLVNPDTNFKPSTQVAVEVYAEDLEGVPNVLDTQVEFSTGAWV